MIKSPASQTGFTCQKIQYIDCRGWFDFGVEVISGLIAFLLLFIIAQSLHNLRKDMQDKKSEYQKSIRRKIYLSIVQICYLMTLIASIGFQIGIFIHLIPQKLNPFGMSSFQNKSKILQSLYVNFLNILNLTVGLLYWKATRAYYVISDQHVPLFYRSLTKVIFFILYSFNPSAFIITIVYLETSYIKSQVYNVFTLFSIFCSIFVCIVCRIVYRIKILGMMELSKKAIRKQIISSILLIFSSTLRLLLYLYDIVNQNWAINTRNYSSNTYCLDLGGSYAIILFFIHIFINLLPSAIYCYLFRTESSRSSGSRRKLTEELQKPIINDDLIQSHIDILMKKQQDIDHQRMNNR